MDEIGLDKAALSLGNMPIPHELAQKLARFDIESPLEDTKRQGQAEALCGRCELGEEIHGMKHDVNPGVRFSREYCNDGISVPWPAVPPLGSSVRTDFPQCFSMQIPFGDLVA